MEIERKKARWIRVLIVLLAIGLCLGLYFRQKNKEVVLELGVFASSNWDVASANSFIIIDEAQNFYGSELKKTLTRIHDNCKIIIIGHTEQCDIYKHPENSGFNQYLNAFEKIKNDERVWLKTRRHYSMFRTCNRTMSF